MPSGDVEITIADGAAGTIAVPSNTVQVVMGCSSSGTVGAIVATRDPRVLQSTFGYGPLPEAAAMTLAAGGTVLAMRLTSNAPGAVLAGSAKTITGATNAEPIVITATGHGMTSGMIVTIAGVGGNTAANGTWKITKIDADTFSIPVAGNSAYTSGGTATWTGSIQSGTGTSEITYTGAAYDDFFILLTVVTGGTVGTTGIQFTISLDAGRTTGPIINLGTATTYVIPQTGITANFATSSTLVAADTSRAATKAPAFNTAGVQVGLLALAASPYASTGWGSMHLATPRAGVSATDAATISGYVDTLATTYKIFSRLIFGVRDANLPVAWGGDDETDSTWSTAVLADYVSTDAKRLGGAAGHYNMPSPYPNPVAGVSRYRRNLAWAWACRIVSIQPQQHEGYVALGGLSQIVLDGTNDPLDGFVYHNEAVSPVFDYLTGGAGRLTSARTRIRKAGMFIVNPLSLATVGSVFALMPRCRVMDVGCGVIDQVGGDRINGELRLTPANTLDPRDAGTLQDALEEGVASFMLAEGMLSDGPNGRGCSVEIDLTNNVFTTGTVKGTATLFGKGYLLEFDISIAFNGTEV